MEGEDFHYLCDHGKLPDRWKKRDAAIEPPARHISMVSEPATPPAELPQGEDAAPTEESAPQENTPPQSGDEDSQAQDSSDSDK